MTFEYRRESIKTIIYNNRENFQRLIAQFESTVDDEDACNLLMTLSQKLKRLSFEQSSLMKDASAVRLTEGNLATIKIMAPDEVSELMW